MDAARPGFVPWFDVARAMACLAVVVYHVIGSFGFELAPARVIELNSNFVVRLRNVLPVFFFLSGVLAARQLRRPTMEFIRTTSSRLLYPYVLWSVISVLVSAYVAGDAVNRNLEVRDLLVILWRPVLQYWYLLALLLYLIIVRAMWALRLPTWSVLGPAAVGLALVATDHGIDAYFPRMFAIHGIYLATGIVAGERITGLVERGSDRRLLGVAAGGTVAVTAISWPGLSRGLSGIGAVAGGFIVLAALLCAAALLTRRHRPRWLLALGSRTLPVYVGHVVPAAGTRIVLVELGVRSFPVLLLCCLTAAVAGPLLLDALVRRYRVPFVFSLDRPGALTASPAT